MSYTIEIATSDFRTTQSAILGGADRIELCANLVEGGVTPSHGLIERCRDAFSTDLFPIIRPRGGDFLYNDDEFAAMRADIEFCKSIGCDGVVIGLLQKDGHIDVARTAALIELARPMQVTFHRAFDRCRDPFAALEQLVEIGCDRLLTSGQKPSVVDGVDLIAELNRAADSRIVIMPGSGVRPDNVRMLAEKTLCTELHASLRTHIRSEMEFIHPSFADSAEDYMNNSINSAEVLALRNALKTIETS